jgi:hypothetical protein
MTEKKPEVKAPVLGRVDNLVTYHDMSPAQFKQLQRTLLVGFVTMGYLANGGRLGSPNQRATLDFQIREAEAFL